MSDAFRNFELTVQLVGKKIDSFVSTADALIREQHYDSRRIRHEVDQIQRKWSSFHTSIADYRRGLDDAAAFFKLLDQVSCLDFHVETRLELIVVRCLLNSFVWFFIEVCVSCVQCEASINEASQFLLQVGRGAGDCKTAQDAMALIAQLQKYQAVFDANQHDKLAPMSKMATAIWGILPCVDYFL